MKALRVGLLLCLTQLTLSGASRVSAQELTPLAAGRPAPDFALPAATQSGVLPQQIRLSELRGNTVVLAFFYKARTKG